MSPTISRAAGVGDCSAQRAHEHDVDHQGFVDDQQIAVEGIVRMTPEAAAGGVALEQPVGHRDHVGHLRRG